MTMKTKARSLGRLLRGDREKRWAVAERLARTAHPDAILGEYGKSWPTDPEFVRALSKIRANDRQLDRLFTLDQLAYHAMRFEGNVAECGTYAGASAWFLCTRAAAAGRTVSLFDSWQGLSRPTGVDGSYWKEHDLSSPRTIAEQTLAGFDNVAFFAGWIPDRFPEVASESFAFVHVDVDLYQPTLDTLEFFYPRLSVGGVFLCDDYGFDTCPGARAAFDEYFARVGETVVHLPTGQGLVVRTNGAAAPASAQ